jgi:hypothetical protein
MRSPRRKKPEELNTLDKIVSYPGFHWILFTFIICTFLIIEKTYPILIFPAIVKFWGHLNINPDNIYKEFVSVRDVYFSVNFIEWFGVVYGFLLPIILVRVWEQFDRLEREFDREADALKILYEDMQLLGEEYTNLKITIFKKMIEYINFIKSNYTFEHEIWADEIRKIGNDILRQIRISYDKLTHQQHELEGESNPLLTELLQQLNNIIDTRGDRISLARQRLFQSLRFVSILTSLIWLIPYYFIKFNIGTAEEPILVRPELFGNILIVALTLLIVVILSVIEDLDEPFGGTWKISMESWDQLLAELNISIENLDVLKNAKKQPSNSLKTKYINIPLMVSNFLASIIKFLRKFT